MDMIDRLVNQYIDDHFAGINALAALMEANDKKRREGRTITATELRNGDTITGKGGGVVTAIGLCEHNWRNYTHVSIKGQPVKCYWDGASVTIK